MEYFDDQDWIKEKYGQRYCNSGGAEGADTIWEEECIANGIPVIAWSFPGHDTKSINKKVLTAEHLREGFEHIKIANATLKRNTYNLKPYVRNLLARNWFQVKNSDAVFAVGVIQKQNWKIVNGGTGWAVQMAIDNKIPVYVFDQESGYWYQYGTAVDKDGNETGGHFLTNMYSEFLPELTDRFAGIGTRDINEKGINAIKNIFKKKG